jgi:hypothetical protein
VSDLGTLIKALAHTDGNFEKFGIEVGRLYTNHGLPPDMALNRIDLSKEQELLVLHGVCQWLIEHKRNSGATDKAIERQRTTNRKMIEGFINTGETGAY